MHDGTNWESRLEYWLTLELSPVDVPTQVKKVKKCCCYFVVSPPRCYFRFCVFCDFVRSNSSTTYVIEPEGRNTMMELWRSKKWNVLRHGWAILVLGGFPRNAFKHKSAFEYSTVCVGIISLIRNTIFIRNKWNLLRKQNSPQALLIKSICLLLLQQRSVKGI